MKTVLMNIHTFSQCLFKNIIEKINKNEAYWYFVFLVSHVYHNTFVVYSDQVKYLICFTPPHIFIMLKEIFFIHSLRKSNCWLWVVTSFTLLLPTTCNLYHSFKHFFFVVFASLFYGGNVILFAIKLCFWCSLSTQRHTYMMLYGKMSK